MKKPLFDLHGTHNPHRYYLPVVQDLCVGAIDRQFLFGGVGLASAIEALERTCKRPVIWATAQYLSFARPGSVVDLDVLVPAEGRQTSQARCLLHVDDKQIVTVLAALGNRDEAHAGQWVEKPDVPMPDDCPAVQNWRGNKAGLDTRFEMRLASGRLWHGGRFLGTGEQGRTRLWLRSTEGHVSDSKMLAVAADFVSNGIGHAIGRHAGGNSLDNTIRFVNAASSEWMLCDIHIEAIHAGVVHGTMHLFTPSGTLMAIASQSLILRLHAEPAANTGG
ncbi:MAG: acyl-CoA thioesterase domain-containing protein [Sphingobium sp.]